MGVDFRYISAIFIATVRRKGGNRVPQKGKRQGHWLELTDHCPICGAKWHVMSANVRICSGNGKRRAKTHLFYRRNGVQWELGK